MKSLDKQIIKKYTKYCINTEIFEIKEIVYIISKFYISLLPVNTDLLILEKLIQGDTIFNQNLSKEKK